MNNAILRALLDETQNDEPNFYVDFHNFGRKLHSKTFPKLTKSAIRCWKIVDNSLEQINSLKFFDGNVYLIKWSFEFICENDETLGDIIYFHWRGQNSSKSFSPLPDDCREEHPTVLRLCQWSELPIFFQIFPKPIIVFSGTEVVENDPHLFIIRGEIAEEIHLYEIDCFRKNLRSKTSFLLIGNNKMFYWYGSGNSCISIVKQVEPHKILQSLIPEWKSFESCDVSEGNETPEFLKLLTGDENYCVNLRSKCSKLFYLNSITGEFTASKIEYPLRLNGCAAPFSFLQSHLYTAPQPALFLLNNSDELWLWSGRNYDKQHEDYRRALTVIYELAEKLGNIEIRFVTAGEEPAEFTNLFPYWNNL